MLVLRVLIFMYINFMLLWFRFYLLFSWISFFWVVILPFVLNICISHRTLAKSHKKYYNLISSSLSMRDHASAQPFQMFRQNPREWVELFWYLSRDNGDSSDVIIPYRSRILQWSCCLFNWKKKI